MFSLDFDTIAKSQGLRTFLNLLVKQTITLNTSSFSLGEKSLRNYFKDDLWSDKLEEIVFSPYSEFIDNKSNILELSSLAKNIAKLDNQSYWKVYKNYISFFYKVIETADNELLIFLKHIEQFINLGINLNNKRLSSSKTDKQFLKMLKDDKLTNILFDEKLINKLSDIVSNKKVVDKDIKLLMKLGSLKTLLFVFASYNKFDVNFNNKDLTYILFNEKVPLKSFLDLLENYANHPNEIYSELYTISNNEDYLDFRLNKPNNDPKYKLYYDWKKGTIPSHNNSLEIDKIIDKIVPIELAFTYKLYFKYARLFTLLYNELFKIKSTLINNDNLLDELKKDYLKFENIKLLD